MKNETDSNKKDVVIIGGGAAGLNAALVLGRARRDVTVIDEELPRNRVTNKSHGFLTRDGISPTEFRRISKEQISKYPTVSFKTETVISVSGSNGNFRVETKSGSLIQSRKVLFATGMKDVLPTIEGLAEVYGTSAFVCPFCDGWELRDRHLSVIGSTEMVLHLVKVLTGWTKQITLLTNEMQFLTKDQLTDLENHSVRVIHNKIKRIESTNGMVERINFKAEAPLPCKGIFFVPKLVQATSIPASLGCKVSDDGPFQTLVIDQMGRTNVEGIYSAGDSASRYHQLIAAASSGGIAAGSIQLDLIEEEWGSEILK
jgi:thioredoxin reductase